MYYIFHYNNGARKDEVVYTQEEAKGILRWELEPKELLSWLDWNFTNFDPDCTIEEMWQEFCKYIVCCLDDNCGRGFNTFTVKLEHEFKVRFDSINMGEKKTLDEVLELLFEEDTDDTFDKALKWFEENHEWCYRCDEEENPLDIDWKEIVKEDYNSGTFNHKYSDNLISLYKEYISWKLTSLKLGESFNYYSYIFIAQ